jgi:hypothetical protein
LIIQALFTPDAAFTKIKNGSETLFSLPSGGVESADELSNHLKAYSHFPFLTQKTTGLLLL